MVNVFFQNTHGVKGKPSKRNGAYGAIEMYHITSDSTIKDLDKTMARLRNEVESAGERLSVVSWHHAMRAVRPVDTTCLAE